MARDITSKFRAIERQAYSMGIQVMTDAAKQAEKYVIGKVVKNCLSQYYAYYTPDIYIRTDSLKKSITPIFKPSNTGRQYSILLGVRFDAHKLDGSYHSNSWYHQSGGKWISSNNLTGSNRGFNWNSQANGVVESQWVLDNFLLGRHPVMYGFKPDPTNTHDELTEFFQNKMSGLIAKSVNIEFPKAVKKFLGV